MTNSKTTVAKKTTSGATKSARPTAEERRNQREAQREAERQAEAAREAAFEQSRTEVWTALWAKALRLTLAASVHPECLESNSWWFEEFQVNAWEQHFRIECSGARPVSEATLKLQDVERLNNSLDHGLSLLTEHLEEKERQRLAELELQRQRTDALGKLTDQDKKVLGLAGRF